MAAVASAAVISGELIIGLDDGTIIRAGWVQGPQGLKGDPGPMGATGDRGTDGNTILTVAGTPRNDTGKDGDYAIDNANWRIYGPKSGGVWGKAKEMLPGPENIIENGRNTGAATGGGGGNGGGGAGGPIYTNTVQLTAPTRTLLSTTTGYRVLPPAGSGKTNQQDANRWAFGEVFDRIDETIPVKISAGVPLAEYVGQLYFDETDSTLYLWDGTIWNPIGVSGSIGGGISGGDSVNALFEFTTGPVQPGQYSLSGSDDFDSGNQLIISDTDQKSDTYPIEYFKIGSQIRIRNVDATGQDLGTGELNGVITAVTNDSPDTYRVTYDLEFGTGTANSLGRVRVAVAITIDDLDDRYVNREGGDSMEGPLEVTGGRNIDADGIVSTVKALNVDSGQDSDLQLKANGAARMYVGKTRNTTVGDFKFNTAGAEIVSSDDTKLAAINSGGIFYKGAYTADQHVATKKNIDDAIDGLKTAGPDYYNSLIYVVPTPPTDQMPLLNAEQSHPWTGGATSDQLMFDINSNGDPYHIAFKAPNDLSSYDENLAIKFTHTSGVMYARIASRWHNGGVHINLKDIEGDLIVDGEETTKIEVQDNVYVKREGDSMSGDLELNDANIVLKPGDIISQPIDDPANAGTDTDERWTNLVSKRVRDDAGNVLSGANDFGFRINLTEGRTGYNKFQFFANVDGTTTGAKFADFGGGNNPTFRFHRGNFQMEGNRIQKLGNAQDDTDAVPYGQVKDELKDFKNEIIEQAAVGVFKWDTVSSNTAPTSGRFFGKGDSNNDTTEPFISFFRVSDEDINGANQDFSTWEVGDIITWTNTINSAYQIKYRVNSVPTLQNDHYFFEVTYISQTNLFVQGNDFILTRQQFTNIDFGDLETTYLRLDCDNSPLVTSDGLEIKTDSDRGGGFGEAALTLNGKRDNKNNSAASIKFKNWHYDDTDDVNGYITYRTVDSGGYFRFNKPIDLHSQEIYNVEHLKLSNPGSIWSDTNERIKFRTADSGNVGNGLIELQRPGTNGRRGLAIRGYKSDRTMADLLFTKTESTGADSIYYVGRQDTDKNHIATTYWTKEYINNNVSAGATNISISRNSTSVTVQSSSGTNGTINAASSSNAGVMTSSDKSKLDGMSYKIAYGSGNYFITTT